MNPELEIWVAVVYLGMARRTIRLALRLSSASPALAQLEAEVEPQITNAPRTPETLIPAHIKVPRVVGQELPVAQCRASRA